MMILLIIAQKAAQVNKSGAFIDVLPFIRFQSVYFLLSVCCRLVDHSVGNSARSAENKLVVKRMPVKETCVHSIKAAADKYQRCFASCCKHAACKAHGVFYEILTLEAVILCVLFGSRARVAMDSYACYLFVCAAVFFVADSVFASLLRNKE